MIRESREQQSGGGVNITYLFYYEKFLNGE
jgi:hypothetical protein